MSVRDTAAQFGVAGACPGAALCASAVILRFSYASLQSVVYCRV